jgi:viroplasmin and RNaseH domain-containing protein
VRAQLRRDAWHVLIQWADMADSEATWELVDDFKSRFPNFQLEDELFFEGGGRDVMVGNVYQRRGKESG